MKNKVVLGDCIEELKKLDSNSVDLIVADPPYFRVRFYVHLL